MISYGFAYPFADRIFSVHYNLINIVLNNFIVRFDQHTYLICFIGRPRVYRSVSHWLFVDRRLVILPSSLYQNSPKVK